MKMTGLLLTVMMCAVVWAEGGSINCALQPVQAEAVEAEEATVEVVEAELAPVVEAEDQPVVQMAIMLDTSGSMSGLIQQAKIALWKIVNELITAKQDGQRPMLSVALYEYGNSRLAAEGGWIRQILPLTDDLDRVSQELFALTTSGGSEHCGQVIEHAAQQLQWSVDNDDLKVIFIAGNEPFTQGPVDYRAAVKAAITKGVIVNTIHCGDERQGIEGMWKDGALLADGSYSIINQNQTVVYIEAPQDKELAQLGVEINTTYIAFGSDARRGGANQMAQDANAMQLGAASSVQRAVAKGNAFYKNANWDLVDAYTQKKVDLAKVKKKDLPEGLRKLSTKDLESHIKMQIARRGEFQKKINELNEARKVYVAEKMKEQGQSDEDTLDDALIRAIRNQAGKKRFEFGKVAEEKVGS